MPKLVPGNTLEGSDCLVLNPSSGLLSSSLPSTLGPAHTLFTDHCLYSPPASALSPGSACLLTADTVCFLRFLKARLDSGNPRNPWPPRLYPRSRTRPRPSRSPRSRHPPPPRGPCRRGDCSRATASPSPPPPSPAQRLAVVPRLGVVVRGADRAHVVA